MGICFYFTKTLLKSKETGASFGSAVTIGRQSLLLHRSDVDYLRRVAVSRGLFASSLIGYRFGDFADAFLCEFLGIDSLSAMDRSPYEGADVLHDLNEPVPEQFWNRYDAVIDAGTLEHIFNFPVAIASLMRMTKAGGKLFLTTPANNMCGHGFYQFSPELMFRIFSEQNGFRVDDVTLVPARFPAIELAPTRVAYECADPERLGERVYLVSRTPVMMTVVATKIDDRTPFLEPPQQSDYEATWQGRQPPRRGQARRAIEWLLSRVPGLGPRNRMIGHYGRVRGSFLNRSFYRKVRM